VGKGRLEAFSDGVIAIIITIMVLELTPPHDASLAALKGVMPVVLGYVLSFVHVGIYWNNHHHLFQAVRSISGATLWLNLHLLFWLSLMPFATAWMGETGMATVPVVLYGAVLLMCAASYMLLEHRLARRDSANKTLVRAIGKDRKGCLSLALYAGGVAASGLVDARLGMALYVVVAVIWCIPDSRIERLFRKDEGVDA
jgi:uncharacterized membrane protein